jgi:glucose-1-phosphatase
MKDSQAIIFDVGNVLINVFSNGDMFGLYDTNHEDDIDKVIDVEYGDKLRQDFSKGIIDSISFYKEICSVYGLNISFSEFRGRWCANFSPMFGMYKLVETLSKNYKLGLCSDTDPLHWDFISNNFPVIKFFSSPILSHEAGCTKPSARMFELAAESLNTNPYDCIYIDDLRKNIDGARSVGMDAILFESVFQIEEDLSLRKIILNVESCRF